MPDWVIVHSDLSTETSDESPWERVTGWDCQVVLFKDPETGWAMRHQADFYYLADDGTVIGIKGLDALLDYVVNVLGLVKMGRMLTKARWQQVYQYSKELRDELGAQG